MRMREIQETVQAVLEAYPTTRNSDALLYEMVVCKYYGFGWAMQLTEITEKIINKELPPYESVRRARQKIQAEHPELAATEKVQFFRKQNQAAFVQYAKEDFGG